MTLARLAPLGAIALTLALAACTRPPRTGGDPWARPERLLKLGAVAEGDTTTPDERAMSSCKGGGRAGQALDHLNGFEVSETASYRFQLDPDFEGVFQIQQKDSRGPGYFGIGCAAAKPGKTATLSIALDPGFYWVVVDGYSWDEDGPYRLRVDVDTGAQAIIRPEDPAKVGPLLAAAATLQLGERALGIHRSKPGGARPACGLLGGDTVKKLTLDRPARVHVRAAAHFVPALELRGPTGESAGCVRARAGEHEVELVQDLPAGQSTLVLAALNLQPRYRHFTASGAVTGAYVIETEEVQP